MGPHAFSDNVHMMPWCTRAVPSQNKADEEKASILTPNMLRQWLTTGGISLWHRDIFTVMTCIKKNKSVQPCEGTTSDHYCVPQSTPQEKSIQLLVFNDLFFHQPATCIEIHNGNACIYINLCWKGLLNSPVVSHILAQVYSLSVYAVNGTFEVFLWRKNVTIT